MATPAVRYTLADVRIDRRTTGPKQAAPRVQASIDAVAAHAPEALRRLAIEDREWHGMHAPPLRDLTALAELPSLQELVCAGAAIKLGWRAAPRLRSLELRSPAFDLGQLAEVDHWPALESLVLWVRDPRGLAEVVTPARFPALRVLGLCGTADTAAVVRAVAALPRARRLARLDLSGGTLATRRPIAKLAGKIEVDVRWNLLPEREAKGLVGGALQRRGSDPVTAENAIGRLAAEAGERARATREQMTAAADDDHRAELYAGYLAGDVDPRDGLSSRQALACELGAAHSGTALAAVALDLERTLSPALTSRLCADVGRRIDESGAGGALYAAEPWLWRALRLACWAGDGTDERAARGHLGTLRMRRGDHATAAPLLAATAAAATDKRGRAWALRQRANVEATRSDYAAAEPLYREALALYRELADRRDEAIVLSELSAVHWWRREMPEAEAMLRQAIAIKELDEGKAAASTYYNLGALLNGMNRLDDARAAAETARRQFVAAGHRGGEASALSLLGELAQRQHRLDDARPLLEAALAIQRERGERRSEGVTLGNLARLAIEEERYADARALCDQAIELHVECANKWNEGMQRMYLIDIALAERDHVAARAAADAAERPFQALDSHIGLAAVRLRRGMIDELDGHRDAAAGHYARALASAEAAHDPEMAAWVELWCAVNAARGGRLHASDAALARARAGFATGSSPSLSARASLAMATAVIARLDRADVPLPPELDWDTRMLARLLDG